MDSQIERPPHYDQEPRNAALQAEGEDEHPTEKKSVLKKVKAKARKIKDTLKLHGHGLGHDHEQDHLQHEGQVPDDHDLDEEDDEEDEEMVHDPEIHARSALGSTAVKSSLPGQVEKLGDSAEAKDSLGYSQPKVADSSMQSSLLRQVEKLGDSAETKDPFGYSQSKVADSPVQSSLPNPEQDKGIKLPISGLKEEPVAPVNTPASVTPRTVEQTRTVDPVVGSYAKEQETIRGEPEMQLGERMNLEKDPDAPKERPEDYSPSNYQTKVTDPTGAGGAEADVTPIVRSLEKVNISDEPKREALEKSIFSTGSHDQFSPEATPPIPISTQETTESISKASDDNTAAQTTSKQSTYTEKISSATSAIADKAVSAKNVVASKLGYGEKDNTVTNREQVGEGQAKATSPVGYGSKIAATVTEKLSPVYEKVAGTGSTMMSKMPGMGTGPAKGEESKIKGQEGVSVKNYFSEKLKPGEEDKALSEVISETLHKQKPAGDGNGNKSKPISEVISGALHKQKPEEEDNGNENKVLGKVTESEQVKRRLGSAEETSEEKGGEYSTHLSGGSATVVDKLKGVVGSFLGKGTGTQDSSTGAQVGCVEEAGERRLQESGN